MRSLGGGSPQKCVCGYPTAILDTIKANIFYDALETSGSRAVCPEVLSVYVVKTTTDPDNAMDVATVDDVRKAILKDIFWQMNEITSRTETSTETVVEETDDGNGNIVETTTTVTRTTLYITFSHKTAGEMADHFHFNADQRAQFAKLLADENNSLWAAVLYGIGVSDAALFPTAQPFLSVFPASPCQTILRSSHTIHRKSMLLCRQQHSTDPVWGRRIL